MNLTENDVRILACLSSAPSPLRDIARTVGILSYIVRERIEYLKDTYPELGIRIGERVRHAQGRPRGYTMRPAPDALRTIEARYLSWEEQDRAEALRKVRAA